MAIVCCIILVKRELISYAGENMVDERLLTDVMNEIDAEITELTNQADRIISEYWIWADDANQSIRAARAQAKKSGDVEGVFDKKYSNIGPRIEMSKTTSGGGDCVKPRIVWSLYPNTTVRRIPRETAKGIKFSQFATRIKMSNNSEYRLSTLAKHSVGWNAQKIIETEKKLMPLREQIEALHKARVTINKVPKRINRIAKKYEEYSHA